MPWSSSRGAGSVGKGRSDGERVVDVDVAWRVVGGEVRSDGEWVVDGVVGWRVVGGAGRIDGESPVAWASGAWSEGKGAATTSG